MSKRKISQKINIKRFPSSGSSWDVGCSGDWGKKVV